MTATTANDLVGVARSDGRGAESGNSIGHASTGKKKKKVFSKNAEARQKTEQKRRQFVLDAKASQTIDELKVASDATNRSEVIRRAVALYKIFLEEDAQGIVSKDGEFVRILVT